MNFEYRLNTEMIRSHLRKEYRNQRYLSEVLRCSESRVDRLLAGRAAPRGNDLKLLADALGTTMEELLVPIDGQRTA